MTSKGKEKQKPLVPDPAAGSGPRPEPGPVGQVGTGIPQPDGSVLFVESPHPPSASPTVGGAPGASGGGGASGVGPSSTGDEQPRATSQGYHPAPSHMKRTSYVAGGAGYRESDVLEWYSKQPQAKPPLPASVGYDAAPSNEGWGVGDRGRSVGGGLARPPPYHTHYPGHVSGEKPTPGPAPDAHGGAGILTGAGYRPPPSQVGRPPKPGRQGSNRAPKRRHNHPSPHSRHPPSYQQPGNHAEFPHQAPYQAPGHPSGQQYPLNQQAFGQPPVVVYGATQKQQTNVVIQMQPPPELPVKTSQKSKKTKKIKKTKQYYLSICLFVLMCICCNPFPLICTIPAFMAAKTAADANERGDLQTVRKEHKRAQFCNFGGAVFLIVTGLLIIAAIALVLVCSFKIGNQC